MKKNGLIKFLLILCFSAEMTTMMGQRTIAGTINEKSVDPIVGATITVKGSHPLIRTETDKEGKFSITVKSDTDSLVIQAMAHEKKIVKVGTESVFKIVLEANNTELQTVLNIGSIDPLPIKYFIQGKVQNNKGEPIVGAKIIVRDDPSRRYITKNYGYYRIEMSSRDTGSVQHEIKVKHKYYITKYFIVYGTNNDINFMMEKKWWCRFIY